MAQTSPVSPDELPPTPSVGTPSTFETLMDNFLAALAPFRVQLIALAINCYNNAVDCYYNALSALSSASSAANSAAAANASAINTAALTGAVLWVTGTSYIDGFLVYSPINGRTYRRKIAGGGSLDPSLDPDNWWPILLDIVTGHPLSRPVLNLDFANTQQIGTRVAFGRTSAARVTGKIGPLELLPVNVPRFEYDPSTGRCLGLLIEEERINSMPYGDSPDTWPVFFGATIGTTDTSTGVTLHEVIDSNISDSSAIYKDMAISNDGNTHAVSCYLKKCAPNPASRFVVQMYGGSTVTAYFTIDWNTLSVSVLGSGGVLLALSPQGHDVYRLSVTATNNNTGNTVLRLLLYPTSSVIASDTGTVFFGGSQIELNKAFTSSYIPVPAEAAITRSAEAATIAEPNFGDWYRQDEFSFLINFIANASGTRTILDISDNSANERIYIQSVSGVTALKIVAGGVEQCSISFGTLVSGTEYQIAIAYQLNDVAACINGGTVGTDTSATLPTVTAMAIGSSFSGSDVLCKPMAAISGWPVRLANADLQVLSTL